MCFHTIQSKLALKIEKRFNSKIKDKKEFAPNEHINGFTLPKIPIIANEHPEIIEHYNWGLIPHWAKDDQIKAMTLNPKLKLLKTNHLLEMLPHKDVSLLQMGFMSGSGWIPKEKIKSNMKLGLVMKISLLLQDFIPIGQIRLLAKFVILIPSSPQKQTH